MKTRWMTLSLAVLALVVSLAACEKDDAPADTATEETTVSVTETETEALSETDGEVTTAEETETETDPPMVIGEFSSPTVLRGFSGKQTRMISSTGCRLAYNEDGSITATGTWDVGERFAPMVSLCYVRLMDKYYPDFDKNGGREGLPNAEGQTKYPVVAVKLKMDESINMDGALDFSLGINSNTRQGKGVPTIYSGTNGDADYFIFDMTNETAFTTNHPEYLDFYWTYGTGTEQNVGATMTLYEIRLFQTVEAAAAWSGLTLEEGEGSADLGGYELTVDASALKDYMQSMFHGTEVKNETVMFLDYGDSKTLMYDIDTVLSVTSYDGTITYVEGRDYAVEDGKLVLLNGSTIPCITRAEYHNADKYSGFMVNYDGVILPTFHVGGGPHITCWQVNVTYTHSEDVNPYALYDYSRVYADFIGKLERGEDVTVMFYGDSITYGADSSFIDRYDPYQYSYPLLLVEGLAKLYGYTVNFAESVSPTPAAIAHGKRGTIHYVNTAIGGWTTGGGIGALGSNMYPQLDKYGCDLLVVAFGMNDATMGRSPREFRGDVETIVDAVLEKMPDTAIMMVSSMRGHPTTGYDNRQVGMEAQLLASAAAYRKQGVACAVAGVASVSDSILQRKTFNDYSGNNLNHPNDYFCRVYAQVLLQALLGCYD